MPDVQVSADHARIATRRSHHKSRLGCVNCKRRRIKCDESKPKCSNCVRRSKACEYLNHSPDSINPSDDADLRGRSASTDHATSSAVVPDDDQNFDLTTIADLELLHNYVNSTAYTLATIDSLQTFWRVDVPDIGFAYHFVLRAALALSALHLRRFRRDRADHYTAVSERHWNIGLRKATALLPEMNDGNRHALYVFAVMSCLYTLARGPQPGNVLLFSHQGISEWFVLFKGIRSITTKSLVYDGPLAAMFHISSRKVGKFFKPGDCVELEPMQTLRQLCVELCPQDAHFETYKEAIDDLSRCYTTVFGRDGEANRNNSQATFLWLYFISDDYVLCVQQRRPMALAIFAYFVVLLAQLSPSWVMDGWVYHLMDGIYSAMGTGTKAWIRWPMEQIGWLPPE